LDQSRLNKIDDTVVATLKVIVKYDPNELVRLQAQKMAVSYEAQLAQSSVPTTLT